LPRGSHDALSDHLAQAGQLAGQMQASASPRKVELEAELQAERQQAALLRKTLQEKDRALEDLATQCERLEDVLEDRNREMDHLTQKIDLSRQGASPLDPESLAMPKGPQAGDHAALYSVHNQDIGGILTAADLTSLPKLRPPWKRIGITLGGLLALGLTGMLAVFLLARRPDLPIPVVPQTPEIAQVPEKERAMTPQAAATAVELAGPHLLRDPLRSGGEGPLLVQIAAGHFVMGSTHGLAGPEEQPAHELALGAFHIGRYEVTFDEYDRFARASGRPLPDDGGFGRGKRPVINVSWDDVQDYLRWLSSETQQSYRLPSEAEWEYAARGGSTTRYWWGFSSQMGRAVCFACGTPWDNRSTAPVGSLKANAFGLYDTSGNVMEWVQDCYHQDYRGAPNDGNPWLGGDCNQRMARGGAFNKPMNSARSTARYPLPTDTRLNMLGFRVLRN